MGAPSSLAISELLSRLRAGELSPETILEQVLDTIAAAPDRRVWITLLPAAQLRQRARELAACDPHSLPLYGVPFAIKDNIDLAGVPTTAGCREYAYIPKQTATVVERLLADGALLVGKTNLDQFGTGLVGTRSPWGACRNSFAPEYISGGSSSGSAVAVATGQVSFALGSDTAGSGRVPAAFNNIVGLKPTCGWLSTRGVVPACRSLDCVSILSLTAADAAVVARSAQGFDAADPYSREPSASSLLTGLARGTFRFGVPPAEALEFFGDREYHRLFASALRHLEALGGERITIDFEPFRAAGTLLYGGPWVAERYCAVGDFIARHPDAVLPVTRSIITAGRTIPATEVFSGQHRLKELKRAADQTWKAVDVLVTPTSGTIYTIDAVNADPVHLNSNLGYYTNFANLLDLAAVAVPGGFRGDGLPFGISLVGPAWSDDDLLALAHRLHPLSTSRLGALGGLTATVAP